MVPGSQKKIIPQVYYKDQKHPKGESIEKGSYTLEIKVTATSLPLQKDRSVVVKTSGLGKGDYVKTVTSAKYQSFEDRKSSDHSKIWKEIYKMYH